MKKQALKYLVVFCLLPAWGCGGSESNDAGQDEAEVNIDTSVEVVPIEEVEFSIDDIIGVWKLTEVRTVLSKTGFEPFGEILIQFGTDNNMAFATEGADELISNMKDIPIPFNVGNGKICSEHIGFKLQFKNNSCIRVGKITSNELILVISEPEDGIPGVYRFFTKVE